MFSIYVEFRWRYLELPADWIEKADVFLDDAEKHAVEGHYWLTCFESHQAAELYLKALLVGVTGLHPYTYDLADLLESLVAIGFNIEEEVRLAAELLTPHYTLSRYPGRGALSYTKNRAERCLKSAKTIIKWVRDVASR